MSFNIDLERLRHNQRFLKRLRDVFDPIKMLSIQLKIVLNWINFNFDFDLISKNFHVSIVAGKIVDSSMKSFFSEEITSSAVNINPLVLR